MNAIQTASLTKYYGKARGIINLNLTVEEGECFGFIGPNGAGKSTTIRTLLGLISNAATQTLAGACAYPGKTVLSAVALCRAVYDTAVGTEDIQICFFRLIEIRIRDVPARRNDVLFH